MKCNEKYEIIAESFKESFDQINKLICNPVLEIDIPMMSIYFSVVTIRLAGLMCMHVYTYIHVRLYT